MTTIAASESELYLEQSALSIKDTVNEYVDLKFSWINNNYNFLQSVV